MEKKYQIFISSTYKDLKEERAAVTETILTLEQIPIGMEMFNAGDETQWELIKRTIDASDYYLVIIGSRYGSTTKNDEGKIVSYTEKEYEYAESIGKPILTFIKSTIAPVNGTSEAELTDRANLLRFRERAEKKIAKYWDNKDELGKAVSTSLHSMMIQKPGTGWIRATEYDNEKKEHADLRRRFTELNLSRQTNSDNITTEDAHWATIEEIKNGPNIAKVSLEDTEYPAAGIPVIVPDAENSVYVDEGEAHSLIIGATGSGKTRRVILPLINLLAKHGESMIVTDPRGELYNSTKSALTEAGYKIITINLLDPKRGSAWNPLQLPYEKFILGEVDQALEMLYDLGYTIFRSGKRVNDNFWNDSASDFFCGLALALFRDAKKEEINLYSILSMLTRGVERFGSPNNNYLKEYLNSLNIENVEYPYTSGEIDDLIYANASGTVFAPDETSGGITSTFRQCMRIYASKPELTKMLATSSFDMGIIKEGKCAVFVIMHDEKTTYYPLVSTFIKQCYELLATEVYLKSGKLNNRVNFVLDEFAKINPISDMPSMVTAARNKNIRFHLVIQGIDQLTKRYGDADAEMIKNNCGNWVYLASKEMQTLRELSELCGMVKHYDAARQTAFEKPLISISRLLKMPLGQALILRERESPFLTHLPDISSYAVWQHPVAFIKDEQKSKRHTPQIFNIQEYVKKQKKEKMEKLMAQVSQTNNV